MELVIVQFDREHVKDQVNSDLGLSWKCEGGKIEEQVNNVNIMFSGD